MIENTVVVVFGWEVVDDVHGVMMRLERSRMMQLWW